MTGLFFRRETCHFESYGDRAETVFCDWHIPALSSPHLQRHLDEANVTIHPGVPFNQAVRRSVSLLNAMNTYQLNYAAPYPERQLLSLHSNVHTTKLRSLSQKKKRKKKKESLADRNLNKHSSHCKHSYKHRTTDGRVTHELPLARVQSSRKVGLDFRSGCNAENTPAIVSQGTMPVIEITGVKKDSKIPGTTLLPRPQGLIRSVTLLGEIKMCSRSAPAPNSITEASGESSVVEQMTFV